MVPAMILWVGMALVTPHTCIYTCTHAHHTHTFILYAYYTWHLSRKLWWIFGRVVHDKNYVYFTLDAYITSH